MKNLIISTLVTIIIALVAPFTETTISQIIWWFIANIIIFTVILHELDIFFYKKRYGRL